MACGCSKHLKQMEQVEPTTTAPVTATRMGGISPTEQCIYCAGKHLAEAWECWHEYGYRWDDLRHIQGALRAMVLHTYQKWPGLASMARDTATALQHADFALVEQRLEALCKAYDTVFEAEEPEVAAKVEAARLAHT